jgi:hypothetical protein
MRHSRFGDADAAALHLMIIERTARPYGRIDGREIRDLALVAGLAMLLPTTVIALQVGASHALTASMTLLTLAFAALALQVLRRDYGVVLGGSAQSSERPGRLHAAMLRIVPASHRGSSVSKVNTTSFGPSRRGR